MLQKRDNASMDGSLSTPVAKRKKMSKILDTDSSDSSDENDRMKSSAKKLPTLEQAAVWKIDRLKASLQKPASSDPKDKQSLAEPRIQKESIKMNALSEEQSVEVKEKVRKEKTSFAKEKHDKKLSLTETVPKTPTRIDDCSQKDVPTKNSKHGEQRGFKPLEKGNRSDDSKHKQSGLKPFEKGNKSDGKLRHSYVIPKVKKPVETTPNTTPVVDTWSDMLRRGAELEKNRSTQMTHNSSGMRRIPKIVPKTGICGQAEVGVLDKIEQHPGFLRWQQAVSQKNMQKNKDERNSVKSNDNTGPSQQTSRAGQQTFSSSSSILSEPLIDSDPEPAQPPTAVAPESFIMPPTSTKSLLPTTGNSQAVSSLLPARKVLLPTPVSVSSAVPSMSSRAIPVVVGRGTAAPLHSSSPAIDEDAFVPDETAGPPG